MHCSALLPLAATAGQNPDGADRAGRSDGGVLAARALGVINSLVAALAEPTTLIEDTDDYGGARGADIATGMLSFSGGLNLCEQRRREITSLRVTAAAAAITDALSSSRHFNPEASGALSLDAMERVRAGFLMRYVTLTFQRKAS